MHARELPVVMPYVQAADVLAGVTSPKLHLQYAKAREADGAFKEAVAAYEAARDFESVIRIQLNNLKNPDEAVRVVKKTGSKEGAKMVAAFFQQLVRGHGLRCCVSHPQRETLALPSSSWSFPATLRRHLRLALAARSQIANTVAQLAQAQNKMDIYAMVVGDAATETDFANMAAYFEKKGDFYESGRCYLKCSDYTKAVKYLLKSNDLENRHIDLAIEAVRVLLAGMHIYVPAGGPGQERGSHQRGHRLCDGHDGRRPEGTGREPMHLADRPQDVKYLFRLYMSLKLYREASQTAIIIADQEQAAGTYRSARDVLLDMNRSAFHDALPPDRHAPQSSRRRRSRYLRKCRTI